MKVARSCHIYSAVFLLSLLPIVLGGLFRKKVPVAPLPAPVHAGPSASAYLSAQEQPFEMAYEPRLLPHEMLSANLRHRYGAPLRFEPELRALMSHEELEAFIRANANSRRFIQLGSHGHGKHGMRLAMALDLENEAAEKRFALISLKHEGMGRETKVAVHGFARVSDIPNLQQVLRDTQPVGTYMNPGKTLSAREAFGVLRYL